MKQIRKIKIKDELFYDYEKAGVFSFIIRDEYIINQITNRGDVCIKMFFDAIHTDIFNYNWGYDFAVKDKEDNIRYEFSNLVDSIRIQNICARYNLAPRIFEIVIIQYKKKEYPALIVQDIGDNENNNQEEVKSVYDSLIEIGKQYNFYPRFLDYKEGNVIDNKCVDFQSWVFEDNYNNFMIERYKKNAVWSDNTYQDIEGLFEEGYRSSERNVLIDYIVSYLELEDKIIWDIGCSGGYFSRIANKLGGIVKAFDLPEVIKSTFEVSNYLLNFDIDFIPRQFKYNEDIEGTPDIIFFLSMQMHIGLPEYLFRANTVVYEHNGHEKQEDIIKIFENKNYEVVKDFGITGKTDDRHSYILSKKQ